MTDAERNLVKATIELCQSTITYIHQQAREEDAERLEESIAILVQCRSLLTGTATSLLVH